MYSSRSKTVWESILKDATKRLQFLDEFPFDMPIRLQAQGSSFNGGSVSIGTGENPPSPAITGEINFIGGRPRLPYSYTRGFQ